MNGAAETVNDGASPALSAERLDQHLTARLPSLSRSAVARLIEEGKVSVNGQTATKNSRKIRPSDDVEIDYDPDQSQKIPKINLTVLYEDKNCVVISKPAGVLTHSKGAFNPEATVATWLEDRVRGQAAAGGPELSGERAGIVHRLDRATSGVMICAKTSEALKWLQRQFSDRKVKKTYLAVVKGKLSKPQAVIDMPIERNPRRPQTFRVGVNGKQALTAYKVIAEGNGNSLLELKPTTGRTHQLRVHLHKLGRPIIGDELYGGPNAERLFLHAEELEITLPDKSRKVFKAPAPASFKGLVS